MAIKLIGNYAKRLGLPGYSSHQFSVSVETELTDSGDIQGEATRIYHLLQRAVDREIQETGFVPGLDYGEVPSNGNGHGPSQGRKPHSMALSWNCSDKQIQLIADLADELELSDAEVDARSMRLFSKPAHRLDKLGASGLISDLLAEAGTLRVRSGQVNGSNGKGSRNGNHPGIHRSDGNGR